MRALYSGAGIAAAAGLLMGFAMQPNLSDDGRPAGPQMIAGWGAARSTGPFDDGLTMANYKGQIPDYVFGTDWKRSMTVPEEAATPEPARRQVASLEARDTSPVVVFTRADYDEPPPAPRYPSLDGGEPRRAPVAPTGQAVDADDEAPTITG